MKTITSQMIGTQYLRQAIQMEQLKTICKQAAERARVFHYDRMVQYECSVEIDRIGQDIYELDHEMATVEWLLAAATPAALIIN